MKDLVANKRLLLAIWGLPVAALLIAVTFEHPAKTLVWMVALAWMGAACLFNARRCGRRHCFYTGPFFLVMAVAAGLHGYGVVPIGDNGWRWLGIALAVGGYGLWVVPERIWGSYISPKA